MDKIFNNDYNSGSLNKINDDTIKINTMFKNTYLNKEYDMESEYRIDILNDVIYDIIKSNGYELILTGKKNIKKIIPELLNIIFKQIDGMDDYTFAEKFSSICHVLDLNGNIVYDNLSVYYKQIALKESEKYTNIKNKIDDSII